MNENDRRSPQPRGGPDRLRCLRPGHNLRRVHLPPPRRPHAQGPPADQPDHPRPRDEVLSSGAFYNKRYVDAASPNHIAGLSSDIVDNAQLTVSAPLDTVLQNSAFGFLQGLYPPVGVQTETLANGSTVAAPLGGYQLVPVDLVGNGAGSEDTAWLQDASGCANAEASSNDYYLSDEYWSLLNSSAAFYARLDPVVAATFAPAYVTYKNAYSGPSVRSALAEC